jgi:hypothetical protein
MSMGMGCQSSRLDVVDVSPVTALCQERQDLLRVVAECPGSFNTEDFMDASDSDYCLISRCPRSPSPACCHCLLPTSQLLFNSCSWVTVGLDVF